MWQIVISLFILATGQSNVVEGKLFPLDLDQFTNSQFSAIRELRALMENDLEHEYMKEDIYLAKWLLNTDFHVTRAMEQLKEDLQWRHEEKMDAILKEEWQDMHTRFPYIRNTTDKKGRPIMYFDFGQWDIYRFVAESPKNLDRLGRYFVKMLEESTTDVRARRASGEKITQFDILINMGGYSHEKHACLQCIRFYQNLADVLRSHFPLSTERNVIVNVPYLFKMVYSFLGDERSQSVYLYGQDQQQWESMLLEYIDRDQVPGGLLDEQVIPAKDNSDGFLQWNKEL